MEVSVKMTGAKELEELMIKHLPATVARKRTLQGLRRASLPTLNYAKAKVAQRSGALHMSLGTQVLPWRGSRAIIGEEGSFAAIRMGPLSGQGAKAFAAWATYLAYYKGGVIDLKKGAPIGRIRHGHLVEFGFNHVRSGKRIAGRPFMEPAAVAGFGSFRQSFINHLRRGVEQAIKRHNAKSPARFRR